MREFEEKRMEEKGRGRGEAVMEMRIDDGEDGGDEMEERISCYC